MLRLKITSAACLAFLLAGQAVAEDRISQNEKVKNEVSEATAPEVAADLRITVKRPMLDENGNEIFDEAGKAIHHYVEMGQTQVIPGDELLYRVEVENFGEPAEDLFFSLNIPDAIVVKGETISSTVPANFLASPRDDMESFIAIFEDSFAKKTTDEYAQIADGNVGALHIDIDDLGKGDTAVVTYQVIVN